MSGARYVVAQTPSSGAWLHYLRAWYGDIPVWDSRRDGALTFDEPTALRLVDQFSARYRCPASGLRVFAEMLP